MTKSQPCASFPRPIRLCRFLLLLALMKLCLLGSLLLDPIAYFFNPSFSVPGSETRMVASAPAPQLGPATAQAAPAGTPPAAPVAAGAAAPTTPAVPYGTPSGAAPMAASPSFPSAPSAAPTVSGQSAETGSMAREALARKEQELARREQDLLTLQRDLDERLAELQTLETRLSVMLEQAGDMQDEKLRKLVDMLTNMKARQAASVLETLEETTAVKVLSAMRGRNSGEILTYVDPVKAARLSEALTRMQLPFE